MRFLDKLGNAIFWGLLGWDSKNGKISIPSALIDREPQQEPEPKQEPEQPSAPNKPVDMTLNREFIEFVRKNKENRDE